MKTEDLMNELDEKLDEVEALIQQLPLGPAVKNQLSGRVYALWSEVEDCIDLTPTDWEA